MSHYLSIFVTILLVAGRINIELTPHKLSENPLPLSINLTNSLDRIYTAQISIGTPSNDSNQLFNVVIDIGSTDLWVFSAKHTCKIGDNCFISWSSLDCSHESACCFFNDIMNAYDHDESSTYTKLTSSWSSMYGKGNVSGYLSKDTVTIGSLTALNQVFAEVTQWSDTLISCVEPFSGILGLGMKLSSENNSNTFIDSLYTQNQIESKIFSVSLKGSDEKSELIIGEPDPTKYKNDIVWSEVTHDMHNILWSTQLTGILFTNDSYINVDENYLWVDSCFAISSCFALIDTGTSYITMPTKKYNSLIQYLLQYSTEREVNCFVSSSRFICDANSYQNGINEDLPYLWFQIGGYALKMAPIDYMLSGIDSCYGSSNQVYDCLGITALDMDMYNNTYILGDVFLRKYYVIFDGSNHRIGFGSMGNLSVAIDKPLSYPTAVPTAHFITSVPTKLSNIPNTTMQFVAIVTNTTESMNQENTNGLRKRDVVFVVFVVLVLLLLPCVIYALYVKYRKKKNVDVDMEYIDMEMSVEKDSNPTTVLAKTNQL